MLMMPSILGENFWDGFMGYPFREDEVSGLMNTDVRDTDGGYEVTIDMPGVDKENVKAELKDGYLTVEAVTGDKKEEKEADGRYIRRERYYGSCSRSFYVGEDVTQEDIRAKFEDGTLKLLIPKKEEKPAVEKKKYIAIE